MKPYAALAGLPLAICIGLFATPPIPRSIFRFALYLMRFSGLFRLARHVTRDGLRIICYHGFAVAEEYKYRSTLFIRDEFFRKRVEYLRREPHTLFALRGGLDAPAAARRPPLPPVLTRDDRPPRPFPVTLPLLRGPHIPPTL